MPPYSIAADNKSLSGPAARELAGTAKSLLQSLPGQRPLSVGIGGAPGTGKSTLASACASQCESALVLSLDDYYLPRSQRREMANKIHPLLATRGVPGTHDIGLLCQHLRLLRDAQHGDIDLPVFDKQLDERSPRTRSVPAGDSPELIFIEGWIIGVPPQPADELLAPVNALEAEQDADGKWRHWVNDALARYAAMLDTLIDISWIFLAPDWPTIVDWRWQQEQQLGRPWLESRDEVAAFLAPYQRLCTHIQNNSERWADRVVRLDHRHQPVKAIRP